MNTLTVLATAASAPTQTVSSDSLFLVVAISAVVVVALAAFFITGADVPQSTIEVRLGVLLVAFVVGGIFFVDFMVENKPSGDSSEEPTVATEPATPSPAPVEGEPTIDNRDQQVSELGDILTERFGVDVDEVVLSQAVTLISESGDAQQAMGTNKEGKQVVVTVFSTVDPDENSLSVSVAAG